MKQFSAAVMAFALVSISMPAQAETLRFEGNIASSRAVVRISITLANPLADVVIWTDSFNGGQGFDPITALWRDGVLLGENDDRSNLMPGQTGFDSGLSFSTLGAGDYLLTITNFNNFANGNLLADGFRYDDPLYPALDLNNCPAPENCPGSFYRLYLQDGVLNVPPAPPVPEPAQVALLVGGGLVLAGARRRRIFRS